MLAPKVLLSSALHHSGPLLLAGRFKLPFATTREVIEQQTDRRFELFAVDDGVHKTVVSREFAGLKSFGQFLLGCFLYDARPGETDKRFRFGERLYLWLYRLILQNNDNPLGFGIHSGKNGETIMQW